MTKKYEKFEEWIVGKTVLLDGDKGVVTRKYEGEENCVWVLWEDGGELWGEIDSLEFLDEAPSQTVEDKPIPWQVGQVVWDVLEGKGVVTCVTHNINPIGIQFDNGKTAYAYRDGSRICTEGVRTLFFSEPKIIADTMPPKKPFIPKLKFDDKLMVINSHGKVECYGYVEQEFEDSVAMRTGGVYEKAYYSFFRLGEEIKFEEN